MNHPEAFGVSFSELEGSGPAEAATGIARATIDEGRDLKSGCWGEHIPKPAWHPTYSAGWMLGHCTYRIDCNSQSYLSELVCCKSAYRGQLSGKSNFISWSNPNHSRFLFSIFNVILYTGKCISMLPSPPTTSPTNSDMTVKFYYARYEEPWANSGCSNKLPLPYNNMNDRPNYPTQLSCCRAAYGGQSSGTCLAELPSPPSTSPTG